MYQIICFFLWNVTNFFKIYILDGNEFSRKNGKFSNSNENVQVKYEVKKKKKFIKKLSKILNDQSIVRRTELG